MSGHSKEPWRVCLDIDARDWPMVMAGGAIVANVNPGSFHTATGGFVGMPSDANAERIVACVNACAGMDDPAAEIERLKTRTAELERGSPRCECCGYLVHHREHLDCIRAADKMASPEPAAVPTGWKLVPTEPTREMLEKTSWPGCAATDYKHMLAAAPEPATVAVDAGALEALREAVGYLDKQPVYLLSVSRARAEVLVMEAARKLLAGVGQ